MACEGKHVTTEPPSHQHSAIFWAPCRLRNGFTVFWTPEELHGFGLFFYATGPPTRAGPELEAKLSKK